MSLATARAFNPAWRRAKSQAFDLWQNSTARRTVKARLWGRETQVYANANVSIYSAQPCNADCGFCVEKLRPASRGRELAGQRSVESDDARYFTALEEVLRVLAPLELTWSITGGEPTKDPRLPGILHRVRTVCPRRFTLTTNGSGLMEERDSRLVLDWILDAQLQHLNISVTSPDAAHNQQLMRLCEAPSPARLQQIVQRAAHARCRVRLSCVLLHDGVCTLDGILDYLHFARTLGVNNVIFRQLMNSDPRTRRRDPVVCYNERQRVTLEPLLDQISRTRPFVFQRQVMGYYYYVEVWNYQGMDVVFEEADLAQLEETRHRTQGVVHELVFHPNAQLASTWHPDDGVLGPPRPLDASNC